MLASFKERMEAEGIDGKMYSHAIGDHGHAAGPTIGLADMNNQPVPVKGTPLSLFSCARIIYLSLCFCSFMPVTKPLTVCVSTQAWWKHSAAGFQTSKTRRNNNVTLQPACLPNVPFLSCYSPPPDAPY